MRSRRNIKITIMILWMGSFISSIYCGPQQKTMHQTIPELNPKGDVFKTLGPNDIYMYHKSLGKIKTALVFVDFPKIPGKEKPNELAKTLTSGDKAAKWFSDQSYGKMEMEFSIPANEWRTMSKSPDQYESRTSEGHRDYIAEALNLYPKINFTQYHYVVVIPSSKKSSSLGTACYSDYREYAAKTKFGNVHLAVTFGDSNFDTNTYYTLIHELGHCLGLPDTYDYNIRGIRHREVVGPWDLMCDVQNGANFIGWHRHKLEWLDDKRKHYMTEKTLEVELGPLSEKEGLAMIVIPVDDPKHPSKAFVVELALPIREMDKELDPNKPYGEGVLVYHVDATLATGNRPMLMYPKSTEHSKVYSYTYKAPYLEGDTFEHKDAPMKVEVLKKNGKNYKVKINR